ncbi:MAG: MFS transporter [Acidimicrobiales bacterium]|jgi:MFS family permease|nr:MFS transporter [Acidimicrobiales bacterium]
MAAEITTAATSAPLGADRLMSREFATLMVTASVFFLATGAVNALLPKFVVDELGGTEATAGFVMGSAAFSALATRIWFGRTADRRGARRILVLGAGLGAVAFVLLAAASTVAGAVAARLVLGASGAAMVTGATMLGIQLAPPARRSQAVALVLVSFHAGMGLGPTFAEWLLNLRSYAWVWTVAAGFSVASGGLAMLLSFRPGDPNAEPSPMIHRNALLPGVVTLFGVFAFNGFMTFLPLYAREVGMSDAGLAFLVASATMVLIRTALGRVPDVVGPIRAGSGALVLTVGAMIVVALWATPTGVVVGAALVAAGLSLQSPSFIAIAVDGVSDRERGSAMATFTAFYDVAGAVVGPMLGLIVTNAGYRTAFLTTAVLAAVGLLILHLVVAPRWSAAS